MMGVEWKFSRVLVSALLALLLVLIAAFAFLSSGLPDTGAQSITKSQASTGDVAVSFPAASLNFGLGSGLQLEDRTMVNGFDNGYALLSSGSVRIQANSFRVLHFTWRPTDSTREAAFFWRRSDDAENVVRTEITSPGFNLLDLSTEPAWRGEIIEFGFLFAGDIGDVVEIGGISLEPDNMGQRLHLMWHAWTVFEEWSQGSINFLYGGDRRQLIPLPVLVIAWLLLSIMLLWLFSVLDKNTERRQMMLTGGILFLLAWILLDIRWAANNLQQIQLSLQTHWQKDDQQRLSMELDGEVYQYIEKLKANILNDTIARILIVGDQDATLFYMLRAKYHLLPHSVYMTRQFAQPMTPDSLDFVLFFGQPGEITKLPGWDLDWQRALTEVESWDWGVVYRVNKMH